MNRLAFAGVLVLGVALSHAALAQDAPAGVTAAPPHAHKAKKAARPKHQAVERTPAPAGINAPSMNFSGVSPETGDPSDDPRDNQAGPRPSISSGGTPGMAIGF